MRRLGDFYEAVSSDEPPTSQIAGAIYDNFKDDPAKLGSVATDITSNMPSFDQFKQGIDQVFNKTIAESLRDKSLFILHEGAVCEQCGAKGGVHEAHCTHESDVLDEEVDEGAVCEQCGASDGVHEAHCSEHEVSEMSSGGVAGVGMKVGHNPDGTPTTHGQLKALRKKQDIYQVVERQNWSHKTLGRIKFK